MLCIPLFLCVSSSSYLRKEGFCGTTGWERIVYHYFHLKTRLPHSERPFCSEKGDTLELKDATKRVYIKEFVIEVFFWGGGYGWKKKKRNHFFVCVFLDWMWPCSSSQCSCWQTLIEAIMYATSCSLSCICFCFPFLLYFVAPLFAKYDFAVFPDAFPCIIYDKEKKLKRKKKSFGLFFTVVSLLYNNIVRIFLEF